MTSSAWEAVKPRWPPSHRLVALSHPSASLFSFRPFVSNSASVTPQWTNVRQFKVKVAALRLSGTRPPPPTSRLSYQLFLSLPFRLSHLPHMQITEQCGLLCNPFFFFFFSEGGNVSEEGRAGALWVGGIPRMEMAAGGRGTEGCGLRFPLSKVPRHSSQAVHCTHKNL